jgi:hypothetical protein
MDVRRTIKAESQPISPHVEYDNFDVISDADRFAGLPL